MSFSARPHEYFSTTHFPPKTIGASCCNTLRVLSGRWLWLFKEPISCLLNYVSRAHPSVPLCGIFCNKCQTDQMELAVVAGAAAHVRKPQKIVLTRNHIIAIPLPTPLFCWRTNGKPYLRTNQQIFLAFCGSFSLKKQQVQSCIFLMKKVWI